MYTIAIFTKCTYLWGGGGWYRLIYPTAAYITIGYHLMAAAYYRVPGLAQLPHEWL